jgi:hypothetical protein
MEVSVQLHARPLYPKGKSPQCPLDRRFGGPQEQVWTLWRRDKSFALVGTQTAAIRSAALRDTHWTIPAHINIHSKWSWNIYTWDLTFLPRWLWRHHLRCDARYSDRCLPMFRGNVLRPSSGYRTETAHSFIGKTSPYFMAPYPINKRNLALYTRDRWCSSRKQTSC